MFRMRTSIFLFCLLIQSTVFADWSPPKNLAKLVVDNSRDRIVSSAAFDQHGNAVVVHGLKPDHGRHPFIQHYCMNKETQWNSSSFGDMRNIEAIKILDDSKGNPHVFWACSYGCDFFCAPLLKATRPVKIWESYSHYEGLDVSLSKNGDFYCAMEASSRGCIGILRQGSSKWETFEDSSSSSRQNREYRSKREEFKDAQKVPPVSYKWEWNGFKIDRLGWKSLKIPFSRDNKLANPLCLNPEGKLRMCWFSKEKGWFAETISLKFGTITEEGKIEEVFTFPLAPDTKYAEGNYLITSTGKEIAVFYNYSEIIAFTLDSDGEVATQVITHGAMINNVTVTLTDKEELAVLWKDGELLYAQIGDNTPHLLSNPSNEIRQVNLYSDQGRQFMVTWQESEYDKAGNEDRHLRVSLYN